MPIFDTAVGGMPTQGQAYAKLIHHLREAQDTAALLAHLTRAQGSTKDHVMATGWLMVEDMLKRMCHNVTNLAIGKPAGRA